MDAKIKSAKSAWVGPRISLETGRVDKIPYLALIPEHTEPCPVVFSVPGYGGNKVWNLSLHYRLAQRGLACISFDPLYHGERGDPRLEQAADPAYGGIYPPETGMDIYFLFLQVIRQCGLDLRTLLDHFGKDPRLDTQRAGVTGHSMGAYASFLALAELPALRAAVPMMGIPTFARRWQDLLDECALSNSAWAAALRQVEPQTAQRTAFVEQIDPADALREVAPRALLVMNGDFDSDQPKHYVLEWLREVRETYAGCPDRLQWKIYPVGHVITPEMEQDTVEWFVQHLADD